MIILNECCISLIFRFFWKLKYFLIGILEWFKIILVKVRIKWIISRFFLGLGRDKIKKEEGCFLEILMDVVWNIFYLYGSDSNFKIMYYFLFICCLV